MYMIAASVTPQASSTKISRLHAVLIGTCNKCPCHLQGIVEELPKQHPRDLLFYTCLVSLSESP